MQSNLNTPEQRNAHTNPNETGVDPSIAAFATGLDNDTKGLEGNLSPGDKTSSPDVSMQSSTAEQSELPSDQHYAESEEMIDSSLPADDSDRNPRNERVLKELGRYQDSRTQNPPLLLQDIKELGMVGELSENNKFITMSFEDVHLRLVMTMKMTELILNDTVHFNRNEKIEQIKVQLDAEHCPNMEALLREMEKAHKDLTQKHSFHSMGVFEPGLYSLPDFILFETMMIAKGIDWLAHLSISPDLETRRATLSVFSELQAAYSSERTLHELYFHQHDDKKQFEERVRAVMSDLEERIIKVSIRRVAA